MELITQRNQQASFEGPAIHVSEILSQIKDINLMNRPLVESIYGMSSIKAANLVPIRIQTWPPQAILASDWLISKKKSSLLKPLSRMN